MGCTGSTASEPVKASSTPEVVLIVGLTGYLASWIAKTCLDKLPPNYKLKATVRNKASNPKLQPLIQGLGQENFNRIELVEADLTNPESIIKALEGVTIVLHVASPLDLSGSYESFIDPVVKGTDALIEGAKKHKVKKIIATSTSIITTGVLPKPDGSMYDENDEAVIDKMNGYVDSKLIEEQKLLDFAKSQSQTEVVIIMPGFMVGPTLLGTPFYSIQFITGILMGMMPGIPNVLMPFVDVRDVAEAQYQAIVRSGLNKQKILVFNEVMRMVQIGQILSDKFSSKGYPVTTASITDVEVVKQMAPTFASYVNKDYKLSNKKGVSLLGMKYKMIPQSLEEMVHSGVKIGIIENKLM